jgi:hypothetical protein
LLGIGRRSHRKVRRVWDITEEEWLIRHPICAIERRVCNALWKIKHVERDLLVAEDILLLVEVSIVSFGLINEIRTTRHAEMPWKILIQAVNAESERTCSLC